MTKNDRMSENYADIIPDEILQEVDRWATGNQHGEISLNFFNGAIPSIKCEETPCRLISKREIFEAIVKWIQGRKQGKLKVKFFHGMVYDVSGEESKKIMCAKKP